MKKLLGFLVLAVCLSTSAAFANEAISGFVFKEATQPGGGSGSVSPAKCGKATCKSYFGLVALGDCAISTAMKNGKINSLSHYDEEIVNILGFKKVTVKAYGQ